MQTRFKDFELIKGDPKQLFGSIHRAYDIDFQRNVIIKTVTKSNVIGVESLNREYSFQLKSKGFPFYFELMDTNEHIMLISSFIEGTTLDRYWSTIPKKNQIKGLKEIVAALEPLMSVLELKKIAHCDFKPTNILVNKNESEIELSLIDFGMALPFYFLGERKLKFPLGYAAPELILNQLDLVNQKTDVFSIGTMIWRLFADKMPLSHPNPSIYTNLQLNLPLPENEHVSKELIEILRNATKKHAFALPPNKMDEEVVRQHLNQAIIDRSSFENLFSAIMNLPDKKRWFF
jgi:serine/threonine protein kinase